MKRILFFLLFISTVIQGFAVNKSRFDVDEAGLRKSGGSTTPAIYGSHLIRRAVSEITLITGGYFTIGTNEGLDSGQLDNGCEITFGHPFAMTSYPLISIDGKRQKPDQWLTDLEALSPFVNGDSLKMQATLAKTFIDFSLVPDADGKEITLRLLLQNTDTQAHSIGAALVIDPALGHWGDGSLLLAEKTISRDTIIIRSSMPDNPAVWERAAGARGMGMDFQFAEQKPDSLIVTNWPDIYADTWRKNEQAQSGPLYDLALMMIWKEQLLQPGQSSIARLVIRLQQPDFSSRVFMRWDMPTALSLQNNLLFPRTLRTYLQINPTGAVSPDNPVLKIDSPAKLLSPVEEHPISMHGAETVFEELPFQSKEVIEDQIVEVNLYLQDNGSIIDQLKRYVLIPAVPLSDTGLVVNIDSVVVAAFPEVTLKFHAKVEQTQQLLTNLEEENIFLYENNSRIRRFTVVKDTTGGIRAADIVFVLDVTGSMGNEINKVKENIIEFADSLQLRGVDYRLGMVTFLDVIENIYPFTSDVQAFRQLVASQRAHGGGDTPENSLEALYQASQFSFRPNAKRIVIWITDANYHESDQVTSRTRQEVINTLLSQDITVHAIGPEGYKTAYYDPIIIPTGGNFYNIYGNFRDILLDISRLRASGVYLLTYQSPFPDQMQNSVRLEIHYAGLGGSATTNYFPHPTLFKPDRPLACFPNPFNPVVKIRIQKPENTRGQVSIYNLLGQRVRQFDLNNEAYRQFTWNARDEQGIPVGSGFYLVQLSFVDAKGKVHRQVEKILYLK